MQRKWNENKKKQIYKQIKFYVVEDCPLQSRDICFMCVALTSRAYENLLLDTAYNCTVKPCLACYLHNRPDTVRNVFFSLQKVRDSLTVNWICWIFAAFGELIMYNMSTCGYDKKTVMKMHSTAKISALQSLWQLYSSAAHQASLADFLANYTVLPWLIN